MINKIKKSTLKLTPEGFNECPPKENIENLLIHYLGQRGVSQYEVVDLEEKNYWQNSEDTLVISIDDEETWRFGAERSMRFATNLACFVKESKCDEFNVEKKGRATIIRFWWD